MRKVLSALLVLLLCISMCGCNVESLLQEFGIQGGQGAPTGSYADYYATTAPALHVMPNCVVVPENMTDVIGLVIVAAVFVFQFVQSKIKAKKSA